MAFAGTSSLQIGSRHLSILLSASLEKNRELRLSANQYLPAPVVTQPFQNKGERGDEGRATDQARVKQIGIPKSLNLKVSVAQGGKPRQIGTKSSLRVSADAHLLKGE
jgi:hypothetical protein